MALNLTWKDVLDITKLGLMIFGGTIAVVIGKYVGCRPMNCAFRSSRMARILGCRYTKMYYDPAGIFAICQGHRDGVSFSETSRICSPFQVVRYSEYGTGAMGRLSTMMPCSL